MKRAIIITLALHFMVAEALLAAELALLNPENWEEMAPEGKEADAIFGDFVLRNDRLLAVVAFPNPERNANMTVWGVGGAVLDLTLTSEPSDQLSAFFPGNRDYSFEFGRVEVDSRVIGLAEMPTAKIVSGDSVSLILVANGGNDLPAAELRYQLDNGANALTVETRYTNTGLKGLEFDHADRIRMDNSKDGLAIEKREDGTGNLFWIYDKWFGQAYGVVPIQSQIKVTFAQRSRSASELQYVINGDGFLALDPGETFILTRFLVPARDLLDVKAIAAALSRIPTDPVKVLLVDRSGIPIANADLQVYLGGELYGWSRTPKDGRLDFEMPEGRVFIRASDAGRGPATLAVDRSVSTVHKLTLPKAGSVLARIRDKAGGPVPCKVQFHGRLGTADPFFGPDSGEHKVHNVRYSSTGDFEQILTPGQYDVIVSRGPEYDAIFTELEIVSGVQTRLDATLERTVDTRGWVSADFHGHASPSGDNTSSQLGRVLNLLAENIEFAPCTEHNRISSYKPHLEELGAEAFMATCTGLELTSSPGGLNHHNAFPLVITQHTQDNGAPRKSSDPEIQIERLALWDNNSDKLVQQNHPDMETLFFDRDEDGVRDQGYSRMFGFMDVVEIHPLGAVFWKPFTEQNPVRADPAKRLPNRIYSWMEILNHGYRIPGVVNTDAHANFHGSGWRRNYVKSPTDVPAEIQTLDIVHAAEHGNLVMSNGPFLQVKMRSGGQEATAGDGIKAPKGKSFLQIRVQCPNWFDIDRVQLFFNGRAVDDLNFTRSSQPEMFSHGVVRFEQDLRLQMDDDTHVIAVVMGEDSRLGPVMGPRHQNEKPVAISNPIFVDVDGNGFQPIHVAGN